jgi:hypothetical protein
MSTVSKHTAAGQMAGYLFQPERALCHLAYSARGAIVGIETLDDVAVLYPDGKKILEQDKHYVSDKKPLADRSKELWNSLKIWLDAVKTDELDLNKTELLLVTNQTLESGFVFDLAHWKKHEEEEEALSFAAKLRDLGAAPSESLKGLFEHVLAFSDQEIADVLLRIKIFDETHAVHGQKLRDSLQDALHLPSAHSEEIIQGLLGWVDQYVLQQFRENKPAWIFREAFDERLQRLMYHYQDIAFVRETAEALIPVDDQQREERRNKLFVKQLQWIGCSEEDDDNQILEAIDAHIRSGSEVARLSESAVVTLQEFKSFDDRLIKRWKTLRRLHVPGILPENEENRQALGRQLLNQTLNHREPLAGMQTTEYYLTDGAYHRLADEPPKIGWHPNFQNKVDELKVNQGEKHAVID